MESLALFVTLLLISILFIAAVAVTLSVLSWNRKLHKAWGYSATGLLFLITVWCFTISVPFGLFPAVPLLVCIGFTAFPRKLK
jgi:hypothetical protein